MPYHAKALLPLRTLEPPPGTQFTTRKRNRVTPISTLCPSQDNKEGLVGISVVDVCAHERVKLKVTEYRHWTLKLAYNAVMFNSPTNHRS